MKKRKIIALLLCAVQLFLLAACTPRSQMQTSGNTQPSWQTSVFPTQRPLPSESSSAPQPTESTVPTEPINTKSGYIFANKVQGMWPTGISDEEREKINTEMEELLETKAYTESAKQLVRETVEAVIYGQREFQMLFGFLKPYSTYEYVHKFVLNPLEKMVNTLRCCGPESPDDLAWLHEKYGENPTFRGKSDDINKVVVIVMDTQYEYNILALLHELHHMARSEKHWESSSSAYFDLSEGAASFHQLALLGTFYNSVFTVKNGSVGATDPDDKDCTIWLRGDGSPSYARRSNRYFKLLALTDFPTMNLFFEPKGELLIREELVLRYGEEGGTYYDTLYTADEFDQIIASEQLFLKLFSTRMEEITSDSEALSYALLYRLYRRAYCAQYTRKVQYETETGTSTWTQDISCPALPYQDYDGLVAELLLEWECLNVEKLNEEERRVVALYVVSPVMMDRFDARSAKTYYVTSDPFIPLREKYDIIYGENGDIVMNQWIAFNFTHRVMYSRADGYFYLGMR